MKAMDCLRILREIKDVAFATVDAQGRPQVRIIDVMVVEEERLYFCTARGKDFYRQLMSSGFTAITGMNEKYQMITLTGPVKRIGDQEQKAWIDRIFQENPSMKEVYPGDSRYILEAFFLEEGQIEFYDLGKTPVYRQSFTLGTAEKKEKGFFIGPACNQCGSCKEVCPAQCIVEGELFWIQREHCLHCGLCSEICPVQAIERKEE